MNNGPAVGRTGLISLGVVIAGCAAPAGPGLPTLPRHDRDLRRQEITALLHEQAAAWNEGDIERFMKSYWPSSQLTFSSGGRVTRGWKRTLDGYRKRYPTREAMGRLTFSELEVTPLGDTTALVLGRWELDRPKPVGGIFTLVLRKDAGRWQIIHDHTSRRPP